MLHLRLLGDLAIEDAGGSVRPIKARKYGLLLAYLALSPRRAHAREELADRFWPDADPEAARACLRTGLASLRHTVSPDLFVDGPRETVQINSAALTTDVALFERAVGRREDQRAREMYAGPLLPGFYDDWVLTERERLEAVYDELSSRDTSLPSARQSAKEPSPLVLRLPANLTRFWGRDAELSWLAETLADATVRLITITGIGGIGKTRLTVEAARRHAPRLPAGLVCFVPLADCPAADLIPVEVARALLAFAGEDALESVAARLAEFGPSLLILDNLESLAENGGGAVVAGLLARVPTVTVLATSRQPLQVAGERLLPLAGLSGEADLDLFLDRAQALRPDFGRTERNVADLDAIRARLDGIPLALELCAAWVPVLTPAQMRERLDRRAGLPANPLPAAPPRHGSLQAALASGPPLPPALETIFTTLSVFAGGWTLEAAEAVCGGQASLVASLADLQRRSLVVAEEVETDGGLGMRYRYLEPVREFAAERLTDERAREAVRRRHLDWVGTFAREGENYASAGRLPAWFARLEREDANIRAALDFAFSSGSDDELRTAMDILGRLHWSWWVRGHRQTARNWLLRAYARRESAAPDVRAAILSQAAAVLPDADEATACYAEAQRLYEAVGDETGAIASLSQLAHRANLRDDLDTAIALLDEVARREQARGDITGVLYARAGQGGILVDRRRFAEARTYLENAISLGEGIGDMGAVAKCRIALAVVLRETGDPETAATHCRNALTVFRERAETWNIADALKGLGAALKACGQAAEAREWLEESLALFEELEVSWQVKAVATLLASP